MEKLGKFDLKRNVIPNQVEKHMRFNIIDKLIFIDIFQFLSFFLNNLVKSLSKDYFMYLSQEFDGKVLVKKKGFYPYEYMSNFEKLRKIFSQINISYLFDQ